ncbi:MAG: fimbrillin family protein [Tannerella sp.]|jgi:hypothetical protein|nr:fimbrillin family protein [Tannerella sp.]
MEKRIKSKMNIKTKNSHMPLHIKVRTGNVWHGMLYLLLLAGASACVVEDVVDPISRKPDAPVPVTFHTTTTLQTRAGDTNGWSTNDRVGIFMLEAGGSFTSGMKADNHEYLPSVTSDTRTANLVPVTSPIDHTIYYPANGNVDFVAYSPYKPAAEIGSGYIYPVNVSNQALPEAIDLRHAKATNANKNSSSVTLAFNHQLTLITINVKKAQSVTDDFSSLTAVILGVPSGADFSLESKTFALHSPSSTPVSLRKTTTASGYDASFEAILIPQAGTSGRRITFGAGSNSYTWDIPGTAAFETGKHHTYDLVISKVEVSAEGSITPWVNEPGRNENLKPEPLQPGALLLIGYTGNVTISYRDGSTKAIAVTTGQAATLPAGSEIKVIEEIILTNNSNKTPILIGRKGDGKITLKVTSTSSAVFRDAVNGYIPVGSRAELDIVALSSSRSGKYLQEADIDMMDILFEPIGHYESTGQNGFTGVYDGGGYNIRNLAVSTPEKYAGFIEYANGPNTVIRNVNILSGYITMTGDAVGGICGYTFGGVRIENCSNRASITGRVVAGGIVGHNEKSTVTACYNTGSVTAENATGGITGTNIGAQGLEARVIACYNTGAIYSIRSYSGGISGANIGTDINIIACYSTGNVTGPGKAGICGQPKGNEPAYCYWTGNLPFFYEGGNTGTTSRKFGDGSDNTGWPASDAIFYWGIASGSSGGQNGYYWKSLGSFAWNTYPQLWWEK